jgi:DNA-binding winged helix-turn-helix (wHTH) protein
MALRLAFGDYELDEARFELRRGGEAVAVQPKVLDLILYLARHRERVVGKDELLDAVWQGVVVTEASLSQALSLARRALGDRAEEQHAIRTVRSKGFQFIAAERPALPPTPPAPSGTRTAITQLETATDDAPRTAAAGPAPYLFAALHCESPEDGGASWSLADIDEVHLVRGSARRATRSGGLTRVLTVALRGRLMSRRHARLVRTPDAWMLVDEGSRNGSYVEGARVDKHALAAGELFECGRTVFCLGHEPRPDELECLPAGALLTSVTPRLRGLDRDLARIAATGLSVLVTGETGAGKSHLAQAIHRSSGRASLVKLEAATLADLAGAIEKSRGGTLVIENLERARDDAWAALAAALDAAPDTRVVATSIAPYAALVERAPADCLSRLAAYRCELPPLRERLGDLGALIATLSAPSEIEVAAALALLRHRWPGNLRELEHALRVAATLGGGALRLEHLDLG